MEKQEALCRLQDALNRDLVEIAAQLSTPQQIWFERDENGVVRRTLNKGWAGLALEAYLGLPRNSRREPNGGSWELKQVSVKVGRNGEYTAKETMQVTMLDAAHVCAYPFEDSHVLHKIERMIVVARLYKDKSETSSPIVAVREAELSLESVPLIYEQMRADYETVRAIVQRDGVAGLSGKRWNVQLLEQRTKGAKNSVSRAWYAKKPLVNLLLGIQK